PAKFTTPDALQLNELLQEMVDMGCTHCFMEVSSHALVQQRVAGVTFAGAIFTNISHDHLDFHKTFDAYIEAKKMLFDDLKGEAFALVNIDDKRSRIMLQNTKASKYSFGIKGMADYKGKILTDSMQGLQMDIDNHEVWFKLVGEFNAYNLLTVYGTAALLGDDKEQVLATLSNLEGARGRFELVPNDEGIIAIVDYAHTPDALENVLKTIGKLRTKNETLVTVVGCGGDRDREKRPKMAEVAAKYSDKVVLTSDNPRTEDPERILQDMLQGISKSDERKTLKIVDRLEAIKVACHMATKDDIVLIAGKGHEDYQEINGERFPFDDKETVKSILNQE
ncbi:MAG: UDP-N-acetylmuramoyl-L-alanyl-D-glutamate--2,6-diaminopimelate ligase, partial [Bacteroidota bacterium]